MNVQPQFGLLTVSFLKESQKLHPVVGGTHSAHPNVWSRAVTSRFVVCGKRPSGVRTTGSSGCGFTTEWCSNHRAKTRLCAHPDGWRAVTVPGGGGAVKQFRFQSALGTLSAGTKVPLALMRVTTIIRNVFLAKTNWRLASFVLQ
jgi:hypothetical protein